jgi:glycosyltransferase involved in cell wall biosynthesis
MQPDSLKLGSDPCCLTIVIRTFNSAKTIGRLLSHFSPQNSVELIIVDSGSTDQTLEIISVCGARIIRLSKPFHYSKALNVGFSKSSCRWILSISSHCVPVEPDFLRNILGFTVAAPENCVVGYGKLNVVPPKAVHPHIVGDLRAFERGSFFPGGNGLAVYRRSAWEAHPFAEDIDTAEDLEWFLWAMRQGFTARFIEGASAVYLNQGSLTHMYRKGWLEVRRTRVLLPGSIKKPSAAFTSLVVSYAYYLWLALRLKIPPATMVRQWAHSLGAFFAEFFPLPIQPFSKSEKILR